MRSDELEKLVAELKAEDGTEPLKAKLLPEDVLRVLDLAQAEPGSGQLSEREQRAILQLSKKYRENMETLFARQSAGTLDAADEEKFQVISVSWKRIASNALAYWPNDPDEQVQVH